MLSKTNQYALLFLIFSGLVAFLLLSGNSTATEVLLWSAGGLGLGVLFSLFRAYVQPSQWFYNHRHLTQCMIYGIYILPIVLYTLNFQNPQWDFLLAVSIGFLIYAAYTFMKYRRLRSLFPKMDEVEIFDHAFCFDAQNNKFRGWVYIQDGRLCFFDRDNKKVLFRKDLSSVSAKEESSNLLHLPDGFSIHEGQINISVRFPFTWKRLINESDQNEFSSFQTVSSSK